jgi:hypothetical protein
MVLQLAAISGWLAYHVRRSDQALTSGKGYPDLTLAGPDGQLVFAELKTERGRLAPEQEAWRDRLLGAGADWRLWRPSDWREIEQLLTGAGG